MALIMIPASAVTNTSGEYTFNTGTDPLAIYAVNSNTTSGSSGIQANSYAPGGKGVFGYSDASGAPGFGLAGISQNGYGVYGSSYGSGITAIYGENLSSGVGIGVQGSSANGTGVYGNGYEYGVEGVSTDSCPSGTCAVYAGVYGLDNAGSHPGAYGVVGSAQFTHTGVAGFANTGYGAYIQSNTGTALRAYTVAASSGIATLGLSSGEGGVFEGYSGTAADPAVTAYGKVAGTDLFGAYNDSSQENFVIQYGSANRSGFALSGGSDVQISGDLFVYGKIFYDCNAYPAVSTTDCYDVANTGVYGTTARTRASGGQDLQMYGARQSAPTVEDFGEAQLVNGQAYVALDRTFASSIARDRSYLVFITPEGDSHGLYVAAKSLTGFAVRESTSGRSSVPFQYRIVAHPFGDTGVRMAAIARKPLFTGAPHGHLSPDMLKGHGLQAPSPGVRLMNRPHIWVKNLHRQ